MLKIEAFTCKCGCGLNTINPELVGRLKMIEDIIEQPITITSGCRCSLHNARVGGAKDSYHLPGKDRNNGRGRAKDSNLCDAADWFVSGPTLMASLNVLLHARYDGGVHFYPDKRVFHCDLGPKRRWG